MPWSVLLNGSSGVPAPITVVGGSSRSSWSSLQLYSMSTRVVPDPSPPGVTAGLSAPIPVGGDSLVVLQAREIRGRRREIHRRRHGPGGGLGPLDEGQGVQLVAERSGIDPSRDVELEVEVHVGEGAPAPALPALPELVEAGLGEGEKTAQPLWSQAAAGEDCGQAGGVEGGGAFQAPRAAPHAGALAELDDHPGGVLPRPHQRPDWLFGDVPGGEDGRSGGLGQRRSRQQQERRQQEEKLAKHAQR